MKGKKLVVVVGDASEGRVRAFYNLNDLAFKSACAKVGIPPTKRQASKWLAGKGLAYKEGRA